MESGLRCGAADAKVEEADDVTYREPLRLPGAQVAFHFSVIEMHRFAVVARFVSVQCPRETDFCGSTKTLFKSKNTSETKR